MSDLVERLRDAAHALANLEWYADSAVCDHAADEITRLRARIAHLERVQEAADAYREAFCPCMGDCACAICTTARAYDAVRKGEG